MEIKKKRPRRTEDCIVDGTNTPTVMEIKKKRPYRRKKCLPHDLIVEEILTKLPVPTLLTSVLVSKLWYDSIHNDPKRLTYSHFLESQKQPRVILSLLNVMAGVVKNTGEPRYACHFFKFTTGMHSHENSLKFDKFRGSLANRDIWELVGYCRGLPCMAQVGNYSTGYIILDPNRQDFIYIFYPAIVGKCISDAYIICHGFGFDPSANKYKLVSIFGTTQKELNVVVFTLGTKSWRNITASTTSLSAHGGRPITKIRAPTGSDKSAILCTTSGSGGCLVWKMIATLGGAGSNHIQHDGGNAVNNNEMEMLLSFNLHDEKFQLIQLPAKSTTDEQQKHLFVDYPHLLGFKGSPCIARVEKNQGMEVIILIVAVMIIRVIVVVVVAAVVVKFICTR
ncbi:putative F-box protein At2g02030 [Papaver somniferum]|uniref:putative F-box protein At2g02030 n=1 Tax=Papaver somniferum TaxID=3469 RepID=UPI000E7035B2|nr:putative F-box protein At2g02030 [Papaver somniferum]XP_026405223.1 putative F-box protein At2g02030 [Papaver somniferum]XP_026405225.1 putative F-box protein At2g02030 [Papaver somniferum]